MAADLPPPRRPGDIALRAATPAGDGASFDGGMLELPVVEAPAVANRPGGRPPWLRVKLPYGETFRTVFADRRFSIEPKWVPFIHGYDPLPPPPETLTAHLNELVDAASG